MRVVPLLTLANLVAVALIAGTFFAFSAFVMRGLHRLPSPQGADAMRAINVAAVGPGLMLAFIGAALLSIIATTLAFVHRDDEGMGLLLIGSVVYLVGGFGVTAALNVPLNDALAADTVTWPRYLAAWTIWNHVRTLACIASLVLLALSLVQQSTKAR